MEWPGGNVPTEDETRTLSTRNSSRNGSPAEEETRTLLIRNSSGNGDPTEEETRTLLIRNSSRNGDPTEEETRSFSIRITNPDGHQWSDDHVTEIYKDRELYDAAKNGNLEEFTSVLHQISAAEHVNFHDILSRLSPVGNTFLHVAAKHGNQNVVNFIATRDPSLVLSKNFHGETALHLAAKSGQASTVKALVGVHRDLLPCRDGGDENYLLRVQNKRGNTALHEALLNFLEMKRGKTGLHEEIAEYLIQNDPVVSYYQNKDDESALYLAAKAGLQHCVSLILQFPTDQERVKECFKQKSPIEAAIQGKHQDVLDAMCDMNPGFFQLRDGEGRNPLHYAAASGYLEGAEKLCKKFAQMVTQRDKSGSFPILLASSEGHVDVVKHLLEHYLPDPEEVLDRDGRNILHLAAMHGRGNVVSYVLNNPHLQELLNMKDEGGNTPLHLATRHWRPLVVRAFTWDERVDVTVMNDEGMTALDVAEKYMQLKDFQNIQYLTWTALMAAATPRALTGNTLGTTKTQRIDAFERQANFLLLVSILIATVTYAAGFTVPGGYNSSDDDKNVPGLATMLKETAFQVFVLSDILAMYSSLTAAVVLGWALQFDFVLVVKALHLALPLFLGALSMMCIAFTAGIYLVVSDIWWLRSAVLVMGIHFLIKLILLGIPLCFPVSSPNMLWRYISYYPFYFLVLLNT